MAVEKNVKVKVPGFSGFDKSHRFTSTLECGTITPMLCDELIPGSRVNLRLNLAAQLPPLVSDTYMNVKLKAEAFFCPSRILAKSFESFYTDFAQRIQTQYLDSQNVYSTDFDDVKGVVPVWRFTDTNYALLVSNGLAGSGSLLDFLGCSLKQMTQGAYGYHQDLNILPLLAYHMIYQEWYRNPRVQNPCFVPSLGEMAPRQLVPICAAPFTFFHKDAFQGFSGTYPDNHYFEFGVDSSGNPILGRDNLADGVSLFSLRQRNFGLDAFTALQLSAQQGYATSVDVNVSGNTGTFTIQALRTLNSLQQFKERNNIPSPRMQDQTRARYGVDMSDGVAQRPLCLGSAEYDVYSKGVTQNAPSQFDTASGAYVGSDNLFNAVGSQYGKAYASGSDFIIDDFTANEPGYLFVMVTLVPKVSYAYGVSPMFKRYTADGSITDMANPILQNVGPEACRTSEIMDTLILGDPGIFGYRERYGAWKDIPSRVHGLLQEGKSLEAFVLQRNVTGGSAMSSAFLEIPKNYMDQVFVATAQNMGFAAWLDAVLDYRVSMPLARYSIPSLQDPAYEHGRTVSLRKNGQIF